MKLVLHLISQDQELFRLLDIAQEGDIILVEQIDRISRLDDKF
ncbi:MAG: hypothetical protein AB8B66_05800 [Rickettsiaceae bacterium]